MTSNNPQISAELQGRMLLFEQPELLSLETHSGLGLTKIDRPFGFAAKAAAIPVTISELSTAQKSYPIVFADLDDPVPLAITGILEPFNLFVDETGRWDPSHYVPAYVRCYPFALASGADNQMAVVIDRAAPMISKTPLQAFFEGDQLSAATQSQVDFCTKYHEDRERTALFSRKLKELNILAPQQVNRQSPGQKEHAVAKYVAVDTTLFQALEKEVIKELFDAGILALIHAHLFSLENWKQLIARQEIRQQKEPEAL